MRLLLTGAQGMLGSSIAEQWKRQRPTDDLRAITRADVDLRDRDATRALIAEIAPDAIIHTAAVVGGIAAKLAKPTTYLLDNLLIDSSVISASIDLGVPELLSVGSAAVYPENFRQPFVESDILAAPLERANEGYAIAKIAAMKLCEYASVEFGLSYRVVLPSNLYGPNDDYSSGRAHLIAAAIAKVHRAHVQGEDSVVIWGDGTARREFTYSGDIADWLVGQIGSLEAWPPSVNLGVGTDNSITEYYGVVKSVIGYTGTFEYDTTKPAGMHQRVLDSTLARTLGWSPQISLEEGISIAYHAFLATHQTQQE